MRAFLSAWAALPTSLLLLTACGGGGDPATDSTPAAAAPVVIAPATPDPVGEMPAATETVAVAPVADAVAVEPTPGQITTAAVATTAATTTAAASPGTTTGAPTQAQRVAAATATAQSAANLCNSVRPFYWEIGDRTARQASGSVNAVGNPKVYTASEVISIASASKWVYGAYVAQARAGQLSDTDRKYLSMRSGYVSLSGCGATQTVDSCLATRSNGAYTKAADGKFFYSGGHMEKHASLMGLGAMNNRALAAALQGQIGSDVALTFTLPQPAGGISMSANAYAAMLRKMMSGALRIGPLLGSGAVCTNPATCGYSKALSTPSPKGESWHYSMAHWVEDDPVVGDGAFSSGGALGFYPWIDAAKKSYGIVARAVNGGGQASMQCGRLIRKAWATGVAR